jgi:hypothetical protein
LPDRGGPQADKLAKDLADFRRRDEIAIFADRLARRVIAAVSVGEAGLHVGFDADRPVARDACPQPFSERQFSVQGLALSAHYAATGCRRARQISQVPTRIMGIE